jgi:hypothetical protein
MPIFCALLANLGRIFFSDKILGSRIRNKNYMNKKQEIMKFLFLHSFNTLNDFHLYYVIIHSLLILYSRNQYKLLSQEIFHPN